MKDIDVVNLLLSKMKDIEGPVDVRDLIKGDYAHEIDLTRLTTAIQYMRAEQLVSGVEGAGSGMYGVKLTRKSFKILFENDSYTQYLRSQTMAVHRANWLQIVPVAIAAIACVWGIFSYNETRNKDKEIETLKREIKDQKVLLDALKFLKEDSIK